MSTTIDQRVAELRFDNAHFEKNVSQSLSTLDKLKQKLNLTGASKGLEDVSRAAKNVNMDSLGRAAETVGLKFNAMYTIADQTLRNITNKVEQTATRMAKALTLDPITTGFQEYETQINAVQTILANTQSKGTTLDDVNAALDELNAYADKTIYNFTEMTRNIGTFTAAGVDLETSTNAIQGIANLAAVSGSTSQQASTAMYQLSQALASGTVKLMDWNSVVNAGMGGQVFQDALKETARVHGIAIDDMIAEQGSFRETLSEGWLTSEVLTETLQKFTLTTEDLTEEQIKANREMLKAQGYTDDQIDAIFELGKTATDAATKVKTFTQLWDVLKEAAQSGWTQTWELLVGDFEQAKALITPLSDFFTGLINKTSEWRNAILRGALTMAGPFTKLKERIDSVTGATDAVIAATKDYGAVVDKVIAGEYGNGQSRWDKLVEEGYDWAKVQNMVNERLGCSVRHTEQLADAQEDQNAAQATTIEQLVEMSDAQLKNLGFTKDEIKAFRELERQSELTGIPIAELVKDIDQLSGRSLLLNSFKNIGQSLIGVFKALKGAWQDVFPPKSIEERSEQLYNMIASLHKFTTGLKLMDDNGNLNETGEKIKRTFRGIAAAIDLVLTVVGGPIKIAFKLLSQVLGAFDLNLLDVTAIIGDAIYNFNEWVNSTLDFTKIFEALVPHVKSAVSTFRDWIVELKNSELIKDAAKYLKTFATSLKDIFVALRNGDFSLAKDIVDGLVGGLREGIGRVWDAAVNLAKSLWESFCEFMGIESPSKKMIEAGGYIIEGLINGVRTGFSTIWDTMKSLGEKCVEAISNIDFGKVFAIVAGVALIGIVKKIGDAIEVLAGPIEGISDILSNTAEVIGQFKKTLKAFSMNIKAKAIKNIAIALAILVGSVIALTYFNPRELWNSVAIVATLAVILGILAIAADKMAQSSISIGKDGLKKAGFNAGILAIASSLLILAIAVKLIGSLNPDQAKQGFIGLTGLVIAIGVLFAAYGKLVKGKAAMNIDKAGIMMTKMAGALLIMAITSKLIATMEWADMGKAAAFIGGFVAVVALLSVIGMIPGNNIGKLGKMMLQISGALLIMVIVAKLIATMEWADMGKAAAGIGGLVVIIAALTLITRLAGGKLIGDIGDTLIKMAGAMLILVIVAKIIAGMSWGDMGKAAVGLLGLSGIIAILVAIVKSVEKDAPKIAGTLLALSLAIGILAAVAIVLGLVDLAGLAKGVIAVGVLGAVMALMIAATRGANDVKGSITAMAIAIGVMAAAAVILTLIDTTKLLISTAALSVMMLSFAQIAKQAGQMQKCMGSLIVMTVAVGLMAGMVYLLSTLPVESVIATSASLAVLMLSLATSIKIIGGVGTISTKALVAAGVMTLIVAALGGILYLLKDLPVETTLVNALALSTLLLALSASVLILNGAAVVSPTALIAAGVMTLIVAALGGILYLLKDLPVETTMGNVLALSTLLLSLSAACVILEVAGLAGPAALWGVAALSALIVAVGGLMVGIGALASEFPQMEEFLNKGLPLLEKIGSGLGSFFGNIISGFMDGLTENLPEMGRRLSAFMVNLTPFIIGAKMIDDNSVKGVLSLVEMVALIGAASIIDSIASFITGGSSMENFASQLNTFGDAIVAFSKKVKGNIDESSVLAAANAGKMLAEMQSMTQGTGGVLQWFTGEKNLGTFGEQLLAFGDAIVGFSQTVSGNIDEGAITAAANAGMVMTELQSKVEPTGGVLQWFTGEKDMAVFGEQLKAFGEAIVSFSGSVAGNVDETAIQAAANAGGIMMELQSKVEPTGGVLQWFSGEKDMAVFGEQLKAFGEAIVSFSDSVAGNIDEAAITAAANAGAIMTELQSKIEPTGGVFDFFTGSNDLDNFGTQIAAFGEAMASFSNTVSGNIDSDSVTAASNAGLMLVELQKSIPENKWFDGKVSLEDFGKSITDFGEHIKSYSNEVSGINTTAIDTSVSAIKQIMNITRSLGSIDPDNLENFKAKKLGEALKSYNNNVSGVDAGAISISISCITNLINTIKRMSGLDSSGVSGFTRSISSLSKTNFDGIMRSFNASTPKLTKIGSNIIDSLTRGMKGRQSAMTNAATNIINTVYRQITSKSSQFKQAGTTAITRFTAGINAGRSDVNYKVRTFMNKTVEVVRGYYNRFKNAGSYLVTGFVKGINENTWRAEARAKYMANAAARAAEKALDINSPSKVFEQIGRFVPEGFAIGIDKMSYMADGSASDMANKAIGGVKDAISRISDYMNSDIDSQPTIRPVLDLSDVKSGANSINGMFGMSPSVGVMSNINSISSMMGQRNQNGTNADIISELSKLRGDLQNVGGNTYQIGGITYDDGSAVSNAVATLIRATTIGGRV